MASSGEEWSGPGTFAVKVVNVHRHQDAIRAIPGLSAGEELEFVCRANVIFEGDSKVEPNLVGVYIAGNRVGQLTEDDAYSLRRWLRSIGRQRESFTCAAVVRGLRYESSGDWRGYGVWIDLISYTPAPPKKK